MPSLALQDLYQRLTQSGGRSHKAHHPHNAYQSLFRFPSAFWNDFTYLTTDAVSVSFGCSSLRVLTDDEYEQKQREEDEKKERKRKRERQRRERKRQQLDPSIPRPKRTAPAPKDDYPLPERLLRGGASASSPSPSSSPPPTPAPTSSITRLIAVDTNRRNFFQAAARDVSQRNNPDSSHRSHLNRLDTMIHMSSRHWQQRTGQIDYRRSLQGRLRRDAHDCARLNHSNASSPRWSVQSIQRHPHFSNTQVDCATQLEHFRLRLRHWRELHGFYMQPLWFRRAEVTKRYKRQRAYDFIANELFSKTEDREKRQEQRKQAWEQRQRASSSEALVEESAPPPPPPRTLIAIGDGDFNTSSRGHAPLPGAATLQREMERRGLSCVPCPEYRTSKLCSTCHYPLEQDVHVRRPKAGSTTKPPALGPRELVWGTKRCANPSCPENCIDRDVNACLNMLDGVVQRHFSHLRWEHPEGRAAFRHNSQLQETPAAGPKANKLRRERRAQPGHRHQRRVRRGGVGSSSAELQQQLQPLVCYV